MLVNCPECQSPVFVRAAAIEQRKPQRCYACKAQLLVDSDGQVDVAVSGKREAAPPAKDDGPTLVSSKAPPGLVGAGAKPVVPQRASSAPAPPAFDPDATRIVPPEAPKPRPPAAFDPDATRILSGDAPQSPPSPAFDPDATRIVAEDAQHGPPSPAFDPDATRIVAQEAPKPPPPSAAADPTRPLSRDVRAYSSSTGPRPVTMVGVNLEEMLRREQERKAAADDDKTVAGTSPPPMTPEGAPRLSTPPPASLPDLPIAEADDVLLVEDDEAHTAIAPDPRKPLPESARAPDPAPSPAIAAAAQPATTEDTARGTAIPRELSVELDLAFAGVTEPGALSALPWEPGFDPAPPPPSPPPPSTPAPPSPAIPAPSRAVDPWFNEGTLVQEIPEELLQATFRTGEHRKPSVTAPSAPAVPPPAAAAAMTDASAPADGSDVSPAWDLDAEGPPAPRFSDRPVEELFDRTGVILSPPSADDIPIADAGEPAPPDDEPPLIAGSLLEGPEELFFTGLLPEEPATAQSPVRPAAVPGAAADVVPPSRAPARYDDEPYAINAPAKRSGGALSWAAALVVGIAAGLGGAYLFPAAPPLPPLDQTLADAADLIRTGRVQEASTLVEGVLAEQPDHPLAVRTIAISASLLGDTDAAERHYLRYLALTDDEADKRAVRALLGLDDDAAP